MRRLILLRHGKAEPSAASGSDFDRALTVRGGEDARAAGRWIADQGWNVELALVSPAVRARATWEAAGEAFPKARVEQPTAFYDAQPAVMLAQAEQADADTVMIVAHNPGLHTLALRLASSERTPPGMRIALGRGLPPGAVALFTFAGKLATGQAHHAPDRAGA